MGKFYGEVGFSTSKETAPDVWVDEIKELLYSGDVLKLQADNSTADKLNDNLKIGHQISIVSDPFAEQNFHSIKYVKWMGAYWKVTSVEVQRPRLILTLGGVYNGPKD